MPVVEFKRCFQAAHRLSEYDGKCARIHGHNFEVSVEITTDLLGDDGFVIEFEKVKKLLDRYDHRLIVNDADEIAKVFPSDWICFVPADPTTEFMAQWLADEVLELVEATDVQVDLLLRETDSISARGYAER